MALNENAQKWVAALRSGKYKQGRLTLERMDGTFCCLGVACMVAMENGVPIERVITDNTFIRYTNANGNEEGSCLLPEVQKWLGLQERTGQHRRDGMAISLLDDNDVGEKTFSQIADIIESEPAELFEEEK
jgi:hypothetical protein